MAATLSCQLWSTALLYFFSFPTTQRRACLLLVAPPETLELQERIQVSRGSRLV